jgi:WS/DGAT/MGAT family acyltransferase
MVAVWAPGKAMSNVDAAWLRMDHPTNLMTITAVMVFSEKLDFGAFKNLIEDRLLPFDRFRQKVVDSPVPLRSPRWVEDDTFNLNSHLIRVGLPEPAEKIELQDLVSQLMSTPLDPTKPLWQFQFIEKYRTGSAVVARLHHCIADGIALVRVLLSLTHESRKAKSRSSRSRKPPAAGFWLPEVVNDAMYSVRKATGKVVDSGVRTIMQPERLWELITTGVSGAGVLTRLLTMPADPPTAFRGELGTAKRCAWSDLLPFDPIKKLSQRLGATINDVLLTAVAGALRSYLVDREADVSGLDVRAIIPVNLRPDDEIDELGNRFGLVFLALPIGLADQGERLYELKRRMDALKKSSEAVVTFAALNAVGAASSEIESQIVGLLGNKATAVMTNVPGPRQPLFLAGAPLESMMFWVPQSARLGLGVSLLSYAGKVRIGVVSDAGLVRDPESIVARFEDEIRAMLD